MQIYKLRIIMVMIIIMASLLILRCTTNIRNPKHEISDKYKFIICELKSIEVNLNECDKKIPSEGSFGYQTFSKKEIPEAILYNNVYIDPFLSGENKVTVKNWKWPGEDWIPTEMSMYGASMDYVQDENGNIIICFAGPDKDIDTKNIKDIIKKITHTSFLSEIQYNSGVIEYDPTNGINSNGDIIHIFIQNKSIDSKIWMNFTNNPIYEKYLSTQRGWGDGNWIFPKE